MTVKTYARQETLGLLAKSLRSWMIEDYDEVPKLGARTTWLKEFAAVVSQPPAGQSEVSVRILPR